VFVKIPAFKKTLRKLLLPALFLFSPGLMAIELDELLKHIDELWQGESSRAIMTMDVNTRRYNRSITMEAWSKGKDYSLIVIQSPVKDKGIATLKVKENIWNYLPKINRVTKVPSSMMSGSWMGSHFTNDDLVNESRFQDDFNSSITFEGVRENVNQGKALIELTAFPKENAAVVWGKVIMLIAQENLVPLEAQYFDEEGVLVRTMRFESVQQQSGRYIPMRLVLTPEDKPGESTTILYNMIDFNVAIEESFFSLQNLQRKY
jgi:outer membrane lipoprotein-sorting protein